MDIIAFSEDVNQPQLRCTVTSFRRLPACVFAGVEKLIHPGGHQRNTRFDRNRQHPFAVVKPRNCCAVKHFRMRRRQHGDTPAAFLSVTDCCYRLSRSGSGICSISSTSGDVLCGVLSASASGTCASGDRHGPSVRHPSRHPSHGRGRHAPNRAPEQCRQVRLWWQPLCLPQ